MPPNFHNTPLKDHPQPNLPKQIPSDKVRWPHHLASPWRRGGIRSLNGTRGTNWLDPFRKISK